MNPVGIRRESVASLLIRMQFTDAPLSSGTGFLVRYSAGFLLITNRHNLTGRHQETDQPLSSHGGVPDAIDIFHNKSGNLGSNVTRREFLFDDQMRPRWLEHPKFGRRVDVVALPLINVSGIEVFDYDPKNPGPDYLLGPADIVSVIGFPFGLTAGHNFAIWATGFIASEPEFDQNGLPVFYIDCRSRPGQSGSAVIAHRSGAFATRESPLTVTSGPTTRFLGVYSGRINTESDIGIVWKASIVADLISAAEGNYVDPAPRLFTIPIRPASS